MRCCRVATVAAETAAKRARADDDLDSDDDGSSMSESDDEDEDEDELNDREEEMVNDEELDERLKRPLHVVSAGLQTRAREAKEREAELVATYGENGRNLGPEFTELAQQRYENWVLKRATDEERVAQAKAQGKEYTPRKRRRHSTL